MLASEHQKFHIKIGISHQKWHGSHLKCSFPILLSYILNYKTDGFFHIKVVRNLHSNFPSYYLDVTNFQSTMISFLFKDLIRTLNRDPTMEFNLTYMVV